MGNQKSNSYWEAELPAKSDRVGIENFIRAKYDIIVNRSSNYLTIVVVKSLVSSPQLGNISLHDQLY